MGVLELAAIAQPDIFKIKVKSTAQSVFWANINLLLVRAVLVPSVQLGIGNGEMVVMRRVL
jgi:hypothetical protein